MAVWDISDEEIETTERMLLPDSCHFAEDAKKVIRCWSSTDVSACPGSGKTTVLLAKLKLVADRMPLDNGAGICVLSHTNVAVNEIKSKLSTCAEKLLNYPNFIGTIQTFIDRFVTFPYIRTMTKVSLQVVDERTYAQHFYSMLVHNTNYQTLDKFIKQIYRRSNDYNTDIIGYIQNLCVKNGALYYKNLRRALAGEKTDHPKQFSELKEKLLKEEGLLTYRETYLYASQAISIWDELPDLLSRRFQFVYIDEFQDCNDEQREIIEKLFNTTRCSIMRIGDPDQAIYNSDREKTEDWIPIDRALTIGSSSRYFQEIANILTPLRTGCEHISSLRGNSGVKPVIIIYNDNCKHKVIESFISLLTKYGITDPNGIYKAIGWVKSETSKGLKIGDYWDEYQADTGGLTEMKYWSLIDAVCDDLKKGKAYHVESTIRKLLVKVLKYLNCKDDNHLSFTYSSIKKTLDKKYFDVYRGTILSLIELSTYSREAADLVIRNAINAMVKRNGQTIDVFPKLPIYFIEDKPEAKTKSDSNNFIIDPIYGRKIHVSTIHKVKGETHDATLYLETVNNRKSDIERVIPYYKGTKSGDAAIDNYSRKCVYVGFSRPRKLLCVAMREETYVSAGKAFAGWEFFDCRSV